MFGGFPRAPLLHEFSDADEQVSEFFGLAWANLARYGSPTAPNYSDDWCSWKQTNLLEGHCAPAHICSYQYEWPDLSLDQSCRLTPNRTDWPAYATAEDRHVTIAAPATVGESLLQERCDFWDAHLGL